jgi:hypothetical protein
MTQDRVPPPGVLPAERDELFRLARLTLLLAAAEDAYPDGVDAERLGIYDFLAANPLLLARAETDPDRLGLLMAGFDDRALGYASPTQRYVTGQEALPGDLARLVAYGLVTCTVASRIRYRLTDRGHDLAVQFTAMYARSYTAAARIVVGRLRRMSGRKLRDNLRNWLTVKAGGHTGRLDPADVIDPTPEATTPTPDGVAHRLPRGQT